MISTDFDLPNSRRVSAATLTILTLLITTLVLGCATDEPQVASEPTTNADLNVTFATLPAGFEVSENNADALRLRTIDPDDPSEMWVEVSERSDFGIQITDIVTDQKAIFEAMPGGSFNGNNELMTQNGRAFYSRGRYSHNGEAVEETRVFQIHPSENRLITLHYRYPAADDSGERVQQLLVLLGELGVPEQPAGAPAE